MAIIYEPKGRAQEYSELAANLYRGCSHGCTYCYAPSVLRMQRDDFNTNQSARKGVIDQLRKDAVKFANDPRRVLFSFTCDPYQELERTTRLMPVALGILHDHGIKASVLTKGADIAMMDTSLFGKYDVEVGVTLTGEQISEQYEPGASTHWQRIILLERCHAVGIKTFASFEPVIDPEQSLQAMRDALDFCDHFKVGKVNYMKDVEASIDWGKFLNDVETLLEGRSYYIKKDLEMYR